MVIAIDSDGIITDPTSNLIKQHLRESGLAGKVVEANRFYTFRAKSDKVIGVLSNTPQSTTRKDRWCAFVYLDYAKTQTVAIDLYSAKEVVVVIEEEVKTEAQLLWEKELERRKTPVRLSLAEWNKIPKYNTSNPSGMFFHKIWAREKGKYPGFRDTIVHEKDVIIECCFPNEEEKAKSNNVSFIEYDVVIDETATNVVKEMTGDYGYTYMQFVNRVYYGFAEREKK